MPQAQEVLAVLRESVDPLVHLPDGDGEFAEHWLNIIDAVINDTSATSPAPEIEAIDGRQKIILAGHSHAYALGLPAVQAGTAPGVVSLTENLDGLIGPWPRDDVYWRALEDRAAGNVLLVSFLGNEHLAHFLLESTKPFDFVCSSMPDLPVRDGVDLIPESQVREFFSGHSTKLPEIVRRLKNAGGRVILIGTPPPKGKPEELMALLSRERFFLDRLALNGVALSEAKFCPPSLQLKLWAVMQELLAEAAVKNESEFIPYPKEVIDPDGFLKREFWKVDVTHANEKCGEIFRDILISYVKEQA